MQDPTPGNRIQHNATKAGESNIFSENISASTSLLTFGHLIPQRVILFIIMFGFAVKQEIN